MQDNSTLMPSFPTNLEDYAPWVAKHGLLYPYGECQCGCGQKTNIAIYKESRRLQRRGHPCRFCLYHTGKMDCVRPPVDWNDPSGQTRLIPLTNGRFTIVDADNYDWLMQWNWYAHHGDCTYYALRCERLNGSRHTLGMHRLILNAPSGVLVDHKDGNGLNNTRANLRLATNQENQRNRRISKNNTSGYKGVSWQKKDKRWNAKIKVSKKVVHLGQFINIEDAARAYDNAARELFGEFARLNFQEDTDAAQPQE